MKLLQTRSVNWERLFKGNAYTFISGVLLCIYFYAISLAVSFATTHIQKAFEVNEKLAEQGVVSFDVAAYEKIADRFSLEPLEK